MAAAGGSQIAWVAVCILSWVTAAWLGIRQARPSPWLLGLFILIPVLFVPGLWALALWLGYPGCSGHPFGRGFYTWFALYGFEFMLVVHVIGILLSPGRRRDLGVYMAVNALGYLISAIPLVIYVACRA